MTLTDLAKFCTQTVLQALRERGTQGHFELVSFARRTGRSLRMARTWAAQVFAVAANDMTRVSPRSMTVA